MARPRSKLSRYQPALASEIGAVTLEDDMGVQIQNMSLVANSAAGINIILNSLLTSNVAWMAQAMAGYSYHVSFSEVTAPTRSAVFVSVFASGVSAGLGNIIVPARVFIFQRGE